MTTLTLIDNRLADALPERRCPRVEHDAEGCHCRRVLADLADHLAPYEVQQAARLVCDHLSVQQY